MAGLFGLFVVPVIGLLTVSGMITGLTHAISRGIEASHAIIQINATNLRGKDVQKLQGLQVDFIAADTALFSNGDFNVEGNVTVRIPMGNRVSGTTWPPRGILQRLS
jgi:hypothetical protein